MGSTTSSARCTRASRSIPRRSRWISHANRVIGAGGNYVPDVALAPTPSLTAEAAHGIAINAIDPAATVLGDTQLRYVNLGLLGHADKTTHLAWLMALAAGAGDYTVFVDAHSGALLFHDLRSKDGYDLDLENGNNEQLKDLCGIFDNDDIGANFDSDARATTDNMWRTYSFWRNTFGRDSYDDDGEQIECNIHVRYVDSNGNTTSNASYSPGCDIFGASNGMVTPRHPGARVYPRGGAQRGRAALSQPARRDG